MNTDKVRAESGTNNKLSDSYYITLPLNQQCLFLHVGLYLVTISVIEIIEY